MHYLAEAKILVMMIMTILFKKCVAAADDVDDEKIKIGFYAIGSRAAAFGSHNPALCNLFGNLSGFSS